MYFFFIQHGDDSDDESIHRPSLSASTKISRVLREEDLQADQRNDETQAEGRHLSDTISNLLLFIFDIIG